MNHYKFEETYIQDRLEIHIICQNCKEKILFCPTKPSIAAEEYISRLEKEIQILRKRLFMYETHQYSIYLNP